MQEAQNAISGSNGSIPANSLDSSVQEFAREIFNRIEDQKSSAFNKDYWTGRMLEWSMNRPDLKLNMFRLVDVLPSLKTSKAVTEHVNEYLGGSGSDIPGLVEWGLNAKPSSIRGKLTSVVVRKSVKEMARQFIAGESPLDALRGLKKLRRSGMAFTADLLGEFSLSEKESEAYLNRYLEALEVFGREVPRWKESNPLVKDHQGEIFPISLSVKLTALYSQCGMLNFKKSVNILHERLAKIARKAKDVGALICVDAEDFRNNPIIYETFKRVFIEDEFMDFPYPGVALQAYTKNSGELLDDLIGFAHKRSAPITVRLVKGAYWDYETILSDQNNWPSPLFKNKESSDANFEDLTRVIMQADDAVYPAIASHNIRSLCHACLCAESAKRSIKEFELQMLYGMADPIANAFKGKGYLVRQYVPLGKMLPGMGYLIRRLLENTSNESFLRHTFFDSSQIDDLIKQPQMRE